MLVTFHHLPQKERASLLFVGNPKMMSETRQLIAIHCRFFGTIGRCPARSNDKFLFLFSDAISDHKCYPHKAW